LRLEPVDTGVVVELVDDALDHACRLTAALAAEAAPDLWHDLARRWLGPRRPESHAASDEAAVRVSALCMTLT
jgi:hypothetical protein